MNDLPLFIGNRKTQLKVTSSNGRLETGLPPGTFREPQSQGSLAQVTLNVHP